MAVDCFVRRFLNHVLPKGFTRIRYCGMLANCKKKISLEAARKLLTIRGLIPVEDGTVIPANPEESEHSDDSTQFTPKCPYCRSTNLLPAKTLSIVDQKKARSLLWDTS